MMKRMFALLIALMMVVGMIAVPVSAEETEPTYTATDSYVLNYSSSDIEGYEEYGAKRLYASPYRTYITVTNDRTNKTEYWNWCSASVLNMINTRKLAEGGEGAYASIGVYCIDAITDGIAGYNYRRVNLEDSGYFDDNTAGRVRAVITNSFPHKSADEVMAAVNAWIVESGKDYAEVANLNYSEVISATQSVIWTLTNNGTLKDPLYRGYQYYGEDYYHEEDVVMKDSMEFKATDNTANNINAVAAYLNALEPMAAQDTVVSDAAFSNTNIEVAINEEGTYNITVTADITATVDGVDDLVLTAVCGDLVSEAQTVLNGTNTYTVIFEGAKVPTVTLNVDGEQDASDVFLFDPVNGRDASQTMAGFDSSALPVHAEATVSTDRILNLTKRGFVTETVDGVATTKEVMLENIQFNIYYVCTMEEYLSGDVAFANAPDVDSAEREEYMVEANLIATLTTDANGKASYNFTQNGKVDGIYIIEELENAAVEEAIDPFYFAVPYTDHNTGIVYNTIDVTPKNTVKTDDVEIEKDVNEIDNNHDTHDVNETHTWIIQTSIPTGLATGLRYEITDTLNYQLTYKGNVRVSVSEKTAKALEDTEYLVEGEDYILTVTPDTVDVNGVAEEITSFKVALTEDGMKKVAAYDASTYEVRVYFDAVIDEDAIMFTEIPNQAHISYENNVGVDFEKDSDVPEVHTGAGQILKLDASNHDKKLTGATFLVYRAAEEGDTNIEYIEIDGKSTAVVKVAFYDNPEMTGEKVYEVVSDENGKGVIYGLAYGTYYLVETKAPEGYNLLTEPAVMNITKADSVDEIVVTIYNSAQFKLPETGGIGTAVFTFGGAGIIGAAAMLLLGGKKKH